jgi:hypothetical protein
VRLLNEFASCSISKTIEPRPDRPAPPPPPLLGESDGVLGFAGGFFFPILNLFINFSPPSLKRPTNFAFFSIFLFIFFIQRFG